MNIYAELRRAYIFAESLEADDPLFEGACLVVTAYLRMYNDSCADWEDQLDTADFPQLFGELFGE